MKPPLPTKTIELSFVSQVLLFAIASWVFPKTWNTGLSVFPHVPTNLQWQHGICLLLTVYILTKTISVAVTGFFIEVIDDNTDKKPEV